MNKKKIKEVLEAFAEAIGDTYMLETWKAGQDNSISMARDEAITAILALIPRWVPVSDWPTYWPVLVGCEGRTYQFVAYEIRRNSFEGKDWYEAWNHEDDAPLKVTHYQLLPAAPQEEETK